MEAGAIGIACATIDEAEVMVEADLPGNTRDINACDRAQGSPLYGASSTAEHDLCGGCRSSPTIGAARWEMARRYSVAPSVLVDLDVGDHRTGYRDVGSRRESRSTDYKEASNLRFAGLRAIQGTSSTPRTSRNAAPKPLKVAGQLAELRTHLELLGLAPSVVTGGGTGTHAIDGLGGVFTELQSGSYIFMDAEYAKVALDDDTRSPFEPALFVQTTVISSNQRELVTTDGGTKAFLLNGPPPEILLWTGSRLRV